MSSRVAAAAAWRFAGDGGGDGVWPRLAGGVLGAVLGVAAVTLGPGSAR